MSKLQIAGLAPSLLFSSPKFEIRGHQVDESGRKLLNFGLAKCNLPTPGLCRGDIASGRAWLDDREGTILGTSQ